MHMRPRPLRFAGLRVLAPCRSSTSIRVFTCLRDKRMLTTGPTRTAVALNPRCRPSPDQHPPYCPPSPFPFLRRLTNSTNATATRARPSSSMHQNDRVRLPCRCSACSPPPPVSYHRISTNNVSPLSPNDAQTRCRLLPLFSRLLRCRSLL